METIQKYTEQTYCTRADVLREFDASIADVVWREIVRYREQFRYEITCFLHSYELIFCRSVVWKMMKAENALIRFLYAMEEESKTVSRWDTMDTIGIQQMKELCEQAHVQDVDCMVSILRMDLPMVVRFFLCSFFKDEERDFAVTMLLVYEGVPVREEVINMLSETSFPTCEKDVTYGFLRFLEQMQLKISNRMVLLKGRNKKEEQILELSALKERYPQYSDELLAFYATHRNIGHYYTIQQYVRFSHVCYETARYSLDQLVKAHWYQKQKMGKKFVYFI